jgi:uncharacterized phiE125 gp8 family phage protein
MLIDVQAIKDFLGIKVTTDDDKIMPLCQAVQDQADKYVDYTLEGSTFIEFLDGDGIDIIQLRNIPVKSITSIYDDIDLDYGSDTLLDADDYTFNGKTGVVRSLSICFASAVNNVKATYLAGYNGIGQTAYTNLPYDLRQALVYLACAMYLEGKAGVQVMEAQEMVYRPSYLKKEAYKILDTYRRLTL